MNDGLSIKRRGSFKHLADGYAFKTLRMAVEGKQRRRCGHANNLQYLSFHKGYFFRSDSVV